MSLEKNYVSHNDMSKTVQGCPFQVYGRIIVNKDRERIIHIFKI